MTMTMTDSFRKIMIMQMVQKIQNRPEDIYREIVDQCNGMDRMFMKMNILMFELIIISTAQKNELHVHISPK